MRVAILGNMNNNGFSLMRYFRDLGIDAHLIQYSDDGAGELSHFLPHCDSWDFEKWSPFVHRANFPNAPTALLGDAVERRLVSFQSIDRGVAKDKKFIFANFDRIVGSGIAPALFSRYRKRLDLFYPYSTGVEFVGAGSIYGPKASFPKRLASAVARKFQISGIKESRRVFNAEMGMTQKVLDEMGVVTTRLAIPMVYNNERRPPGLSSACLIKAVAERIREADFVVFSHSSHRWLDDKLDSRRPSKNNNWLISGFSQLRLLRPKVKALLVLLDYGPDVDASKRLVFELGLTDSVLWVPKLERKMLSFLMSLVDVVAGEFIETPRTILGGTGWEALAAGKPLLNGFMFEDGEYERLMGHCRPPLLPIKNIEEVGAALISLNDNVNLCRRVGGSSLAWFNEYQGINLAKRWLAELEKLP